MRKAGEPRGIPKPDRVARLTALAFVRHSGRAAEVASRYQEGGRSASSEVTLPSVARSRPPEARAPTYTPTRTKAAPTAASGETDSASSHAPSAVATNGAMTNSYETDDACQPFST